MKNIGICPADILLPQAGVQPETWACVACDQYTSQPEYWQEVEQLVGAAPSTLRLMLPECYLAQTEQRVPVINQTMRDYLESGVLQQAVNGYVLVERTTHSGKRIGLVGAVDLEEYDYTPGSKPLVRPTEETIAARLPARLAIRQGAAIEMSHIMMLVDDPLRTVIEPLYARHEQLRPLYDFPLMQQGGHLRGWAVEADGDMAAIAAALEALRDGQGKDPLLFAVGDGNHSLATAKAAWEALKPQLSEEERAVHPARFALCEVENIHDEALTFEPIHRIVTGVDAPQLMQDWADYCQARGMALAEEGAQKVQVISADGEKTVAVANPDGAIPVDTLQRYLDDFLRRHPEAEIDYIHGDDVLRSLAQQEGSIGFLVPPIDKGTFFDAIKQLGTLPRKTFSMGHAHEKRFYMECKRII